MISIIQDLRITIHNSCRYLFSITEHLSCRLSHNSHSVSIQVLISSLSTTTCQLYLKDAVFISVAVHIAYSVQSPIVSHAKQITYFGCHRSRAISLSFGTHTLIGSVSIIKVSRRGKYSWWLSHCVTERKTSV